MKIPTDLKPGDRLWYSKTEYATVGKEPFFGDLYRSEPTRIMAESSDGEHLLIYVCETGAEREGATPPIIRIERIASKAGKAKVDRDAAWLLHLLHYPEFTISLARTRRLRAIARRLNGEGKL